MKRRNFLAVAGCAAGLSIGSCVEFPHPMVEPNAFVKVSLPGAEADAGAVQYSREGELFASRLGGKKVKTLDFEEDRLVLTFLNNTNAELHYVVEAFSSSPFTEITWADEDKKSGALLLSEAEGLDNVDEEDGPDAGVAVNPEVFTVQAGTRSKIVLYVKEIPPDNVTGGAADNS